MRPALIVTAALLATACATPPPAYAPASMNSTGVGYDDVRIENDRWRVSYTARGDGSELEAERLALRRAADLVQRSGFDWFEVVDRRTRTEGEDRSPVRVGGSVSRGWGSRGYSGTGVGIGISLSPQAQATTTATLEVIAGSGDPVPDGAYDAASILMQSPSP